MRFYHWENEDIIKILPFVDPKTNNLQWGKKCDIVFLETYKLNIYDISGKNYLSKIASIVNKTDKPYIRRKWIFSAIIDGNIYAIFVGKILYDIIMEDISKFNISSNKFLKVKITFTKEGFSSYDKSFVFENPDELSTFNLMDEDQCIEWIKKNQGDISFSNFDIFNQRELVNKYAEGCPNRVGGHFYCLGNPIYESYKKWGSYKEFIRDQKLNSLLI